MPKVRYNPGQVSEKGSLAYFPGCYEVVFRLMGKPCHSAANAANIGLSNTQIDYRRSDVNKSYGTQSFVFKSLTQRANEGLTAITDPVIGDATQVGVGEYDDGVPPTP